MIKSKFPGPGDLVVCTVKDVRKGSGAFTHLDEYDKEGFIHISEVASGWIKYIGEHVKKGQKIVCKVLRVDLRKGHIDLSLKRVNEHQRREKIKEWKNEQKATKLFELVAKRLGKSRQQCLHSFGNRLVAEFGSLYDAFEKTAMEREALNKFKGDWVKAVVEVAKENIKPPEVEVYGYIELSSLLPEGVKWIKGALLKAMEEGVEVAYMGAPKYRVKAKASNYKAAEEKLKKAAERALGHLEGHGEGRFVRK